jgi:hypothetical protein
MLGQLPSDHYTFLQDPGPPRWMRTKGPSRAASQILLGLHVILFLTVQWVVVSPLLSLPQLLCWIWLPTVTMPFATFLASQSFWDNCGPWGPADAPSPPLQSSVESLKLWLERVLATSKMPEVPKMYHTKDKVTQHIDPSTSTQYFGKLDAWAGSIAFPGLTKFAETVIKLDSRGRAAPIQGHDIAGIINNLQLQCEVLQLLKVSCPRLEIPNRDAISLMPCK